MKMLLSTLVFAAALGLGSGARAGLMTFNNPGLIDIDPVTNVATYAEAGFTISGDAASFLTIDNALLGFPGARLSLKALGLGPFSLTSLERAFYDLGFGDPPGILSVVGLLDGLQVASADLTLGGLTGAGFGPAWRRLTEVRFSATSAFLLDNINAIPEPVSAALVMLALAGATLGSRRRSLGRS